jgi:hypothetical protein
MGMAEMPEWVRPAHSDVRGAHHTASELYARTPSLTSGGIFATLNWVIGYQPSPVSERAEPASWELARAEAWLALCCAAEMDPPPARDWPHLGVAQRPAKACNPQWCFGVWSTLAWLLGNRDDPPVTPAADGPDPAGQADPRSPEPLAARRAERERQRAEARRRWLYIRALADR